MYNLTQRRRNSFGSMRDKNGHCREATQRIQKHQSPGGRGFGAWRICRRCTHTRSMFVYIECSPSHLAYIRCASNYADCTPPTPAMSIVQCARLATSGSYDSATYVAALL